MATAPNLPLQDGSAAGGGGQAFSPADAGAAARGVQPYTIPIEDDTTAASTPRGRAAGSASSTGAMGRTRSPPRRGRPSCPGGSRTPSTTTGSASRARSPCLMRSKASDSTNFHNNYPIPKRPKAKLLSRPASQLCCCKESPKHPSPNPTSQYPRPKPSLSHSSKQCFKA